MVLERRIQRTAKDIYVCASSHPAAEDVLRRLEETTCEHLDKLRERMQTTPNIETDAGTGGDGASTMHSQFAELHPVSSALGVAYAVVQEGIIGYSTILPIATRVRDSWVAADEGTTAHIARRHTQEYMGVAGQITALIHDVVLWELDRDGFECNCTCPSCGVGLCLCALSGRSVLAEAWVAARPPVAQHGVELKPPRPGSAAAVAGFLQGDVIVAIDGEKVDSTQVLQRAIRDHEAGDLMEIIVRRKAGEATVVVEHRRDGVDLNEDECILPAGQHFYLDQARDVQRRLRKGGSGDPLNGAAFSSLSARELQVLRLVAQGATNPIIADELEISRATVARHVATILQKTGLANRTEAATVASQHGLLPDL
jgi:DNA-binding CsgD family transcriptional regulator